MPNDNFKEIVRALSKRLENLLLHEISIGTSSRVYGATRLKREELFKRLELLRDQLPICSELCQNAARYEPEIFHQKALKKSLKASCKALDREKFKGMHGNTLYNRLLLLVDELQFSREVLQDAAFSLGKRIDPEARLDTCTPEEVEAVYGEDQNGRALVACLRADAELTHCLSETWFILKGRFGWVPDPSGGSYENSRGAQIAAHLIGMAYGMGIDWTRNKASPPHSACDAAAEARILPCAPISATAHTVHAEIPMGYEGMEHVWRAARGDEMLGSHMQTGVTLGERLAQKCSKSAS